MKLTSLAMLMALVVGHVHVYASPVEDVLSPSGVPATSGLPFSTLSFDTTAAPSLLSALSSLISSESTAVTPFTTPSGTARPSPSGSVITSYATYAPPSPTTISPTVTVVTSSAVPTSTSAARSLRDGVRSGVVVGIVIGAVVVLA